MKGLFALLAAFLLATGAIGKEAAPLAEDEAVEKRLLNIAEELRCLVCQNESLAGSRADLAEDLRREVRGLIKQGKTDQEVKDFLVSRYGDFVLYAPPVKPTTWLLWGGPFVLLAAGVVALFAYLRRRGGQVGKAELTEDDEKRAEALLKDNP
ncbi:MAG: cytochrome c-type biogenesis protein CcmH [Rhodocyclaceae bacterium]|nr:cytochrome c-type biogenesis protein CcmH [Rhodocyclaceae bacterium]